MQSRVCLTLRRLTEHPRTTNGPSDKDVHNAEVRGEGVPGAWAEVPAVLGEEGGDRPAMGHGGEDAVAEAGRGQGVAGRLDPRSRS